MPRKRKVGNDFENSFVEFFAPAGNGRPATTTGPSVRNFMYNAEQTANGIKQLFTPNPNQRKRRGRSI